MQPTAKDGFPLPMTRSPVYRIGGDEFVAILTGADYQQREQLFESFRRENVERLETGGLTVACGMADAEGGRDASLDDVITRADAAMYENKKQLKTAD